MSKIIISVVFFLLIGFFIYQSWTSIQATKQNLAQGQAFLAENKTKENIHTTDSGLQYLILEEGTGKEHPTTDSQVKVHYEGKLLDGTIFDSSYQRQQPITFALNQVIPGWQEGLQLMVVGQKMRLFIPSNLGYGSNSAGAIPPASTLIFDVELLDFK